MRREDLLASGTEENVGRSPGIERGVHGCLSVVGLSQRYHRDMYREWEEGVIESVLSDS